MRFKCRGSFGFKTDKHAHISTGRWSEFMVSIVRYSILNPSIDLLQPMLTVSLITTSISDITHALLVLIPQSTVHAWYFQFLAQSGSILMAHSATNNHKASVQGILTGQSCGACTRSIGEYFYHSFCYTNRRRVWGHVYSLMLSHSYMSHILPIQNLRVSSVMVSRILSQTHYPPLP